MAIFKTDRLILRRFHSKDWMDLYEYLSQEQVVKYEPYGILTDKECEKEAALRSRNEAFIAVCLRDSNKLIGNIYFAQQEPKEYGNWEIGYVFIYSQVENENTFNEVINYMKDNNISLVGAVHEYNCPEDGHVYLFCPIKKL